MIPVLIVIANNVVKEAIAYRSAEELEAAFVQENKEYGRETNSDEMALGYVELEDVTICMVWAGWPESEDAWRVVPEYPVSDWQCEVNDDDTRLGYLDWVASKQEEARDDAATRPTMPQLLSSTPSPQDSAATRLAAVIAYLTDQTEDGWRVFCQTLLEMGMPFQFTDSAELTRHDGRVSLNGDLYVGFAELGLAELATGFGNVVACDWWSGRPRVLAWADINDCDPQIVELAAAFETWRRPDEQESNDVSD